MLFMAPKLAAIGQADKGQRGTASFRTLPHVRSNHKQAQLPAPGCSRYHGGQSTFMSHDRVANGGDIVAEECRAGVPRPATLDRDERDALTELKLWIEDADIHGRDHDDARFKREWMRDRLAVLRDPHGRG